MKKLGFGFMRLPLLNKTDWADININLVTKMVDLYLEKGFTYFDTAYGYHLGKSETAIKKVLTQRYPRESFVLADKMPIFLIQEKEQFDKVFNEQLKRCGVEFFDYYLIHSLNGKTYSKDLVRKDVFDFLTKIKIEKKAKHIGFSFHDKADVLDCILSEHAEIDFVQLQINYIDWKDEAIESEKCYKIAQKHDKPVIVMEPVKGGNLAILPYEIEQNFKNYNPNMSVASWAIRFAASLKNVFIVLSGMSNLEQVADNIGYMEQFTPLNAIELDIIERLIPKIKQNIIIPCTGCRYCLDNCPSKIPIAYLFFLFNDKARLGVFPDHLKIYSDLTSKSGKPSDCIECRSCEKKCPQNISVVNI